MSLANAGYDVVVASGSEQPPNITRLESTKKGGNLSHIGLDFCPCQKQSQLQKSLQLIFGSSSGTLRWLDAQPIKPSHLVLYGGYTPYMLRLLPWCRRNNVALIADIVEWYEPCYQIGGLFGLSNINVNIALRYLFQKCDGIIAISSYLENFYRDRGCPVVRVPPTLDVSSILLPTIMQKRETKPLTLIYAGSEGKRDLLNNVIRGTLLADPVGNQTRLQILGLSLSQVYSLYGSDALPSFVQVLGRIEQTEVARIVQQADFCVFLREPLRFSKAGFSTKFVESMANGTPVITNSTSDFDEHLHDGVNGLVVNDHSAQAFAHTLKRALSLNPDELQHMRLAARRQAEISFDYRNYSEKIASFFKTIRV
jgi:glycosyltransferase involved in cell wall biosynthesis